MAMEVHKSTLIEYSAESMFDLIEAVEHYPAFLPWCAGATVLRATIPSWLRMSGSTFTGFAWTLLRAIPSGARKAMAITLEQGPFRRFEGNWRLTPLAAAACKIEFALSYEFDSAIARTLAGPVFARIADTMIDAFVARADSVLNTQLPSASRTAAHPQPMEPEAMTDKTKLQALQASRLGADLDERECGVLCELVTVRELADQEVLVREDTTDNHLYVVADGTLGVVRNINSDQRLTIATLGAGDLAGELSFIDATKRHASLVALGRTRVLGLEREHFESLADEHPLLFYHVIRAIVRTVHIIQQRLSLQAVELSNYIYKQHGRY